MREGKRALRRRKVGRGKGEMGVDGEKKEKKGKGNGDESCALAPVLILQI